MGDFRKLKVWERAHSHTMSVYLLTSGFPKSELYGLTSQLRRAAVSIAANIAEGCGRNRPRDTARFLEIALGSANEVSYLILLARDLGYLGSTAWQELDWDIIAIRRMLATLGRTVRAADGTHRTSQANSLIADSR